MMNYYLTQNRPIGPLRVPRGMPTDQQVDSFMKSRNTPGSQLSVVMGDPICARETIQRFKNAGVDELIFVIQTGTQPQELIMESIRTLAEDVIPHFK